MWIKIKCAIGLHKWTCDWFWFVNGDKRYKLCECAHCGVQKKIYL